MILRVLLSEKALKKKKLENWCFLAFFFYVEKNVLVIVPQGESDDPIPDGLSHQIVRGGSVCCCVVASQGLSCSCGE